MTSIAFECQPNCTRCCEVKGNVYLTEDDLKNIAAYLGMSEGDFEAKYVVRTKTLLRLRKPRNSQCHFLDGGCRVHPVKPVQCRLYPFWPELVERPANWRREAAACPGIGKGELIQITKAMEIAGEMRKAYPSTYR